MNHPVLHSLIFLSFFYRILHLVLEIIELTLWSQSRLIKVCLEQNPCCDVVPMQKGGSEGCKAETVLKILKQNPSDTRANQTLMHEHIGGFRSRAGVVSGLQWRDDHEFIKTAISGRQILGFSS